MQYVCHGVCIVDRCSEFSNSPPVHCVPPRQTSPAHQKQNRPPSHLPAPPPSSGRNDPAAIAAHLAPRGLLEQAERPPHPLALPLPVGPSACKCVCVCVHVRDSLCGLNVCVCACMCVRLERQHSPTYFCACMCVRPVRQHSPTHIGYISRRACATLPLGLRIGQS